jgi:hypothetical protein
MRSTHAQHASHVRTEPYLLPCRMFDVHTHVPNCCHVSASMPYMRTCINACNECSAHVFVCVCVCLCVCVSAGGNRSPRFISPTPNASSTFAVIMAVESVQPLFTLNVTDDNHDDVELSLTSGQGLDTVKCVGGTDACLLSVSCLITLSCADVLSCMHTDDVLQARSKTYVSGGCHALVTHIPALPCPPHTAVQRCAGMGSAD